MAKIDSGIYESMARVLRASGQLEQLTESFCTNNSRRMSDLKLAVTNNDKPTAGEIVHALKGSCSMFGAISCAELCRQIEHKLEKTRAINECTELTSLLSHLDAELSAVSEYLRSYVSDQKPECCP
jgi:HPt (histidine-containing phosphotransfer) domain-containing protein